MASYNKRISDQSKIKFDPINRELIDSENSELDSRVDALETTVGDATSGLVKDVNDLETADNIINGNLSAIYTNGAKNILPITLSYLKEANNSGTWDGDVYTHNGVTYTFTESNGYITDILSNGTATDGNSILYIYGKPSARAKNLRESVILTGCPANGSETTYSIRNTCGNLPTSGDVEYKSDIGSGVTIDSDYLSSYIRIYNNTEVSNLRFSPMFRDSDITDNNYQPYAMTNLELTNKVADLESRVYALEHPTP